MKSHSHSRMAHGRAATTVYGGITLIFFEALNTALFVLVLWSVQPIFAIRNFKNMVKTAPQQAINWLQSAYTHIFIP